MTEIVIRVPKRARLRDEAPLKLGFYTPYQLGPNQSLTNEGFLLCSNVPIGRTGNMLYTEKDLSDVTPDRNGVITIERSGEEVFRAETLASFEGKPVTLGHPPFDVTPENWKQFAVGVIQNVRRGEGEYADCIVADLLITDETAIAEVRDGKREVSCGYDADYEEIRAGLGRQKNIIGNHVALVERGRAGSRCAIKDRSSDMAKQSIRDRIAAAFKSQDQKSLDDALNEISSPAPEATGSTHVHVHLKDGKDEEEKKEEKKEETKDAEGDDRIDRILALLEKMCGSTSDEEKEEKEDDKKDKAKDKKSRDAESVKDFSTRAEILVPGFKTPTHDSAAETLTTEKRKVMGLAFATRDGAAALSPFVGDKPDFDKMDVATVDAVFVASSELIRSKNNSSVTKLKDHQGATPQPVSIADINKRNAEFWSNRK